MIIWIILAVAMLVLPVLGLWPVIVRGDGARNNLALVTMPSRQWYDREGYDYRATRAQEIVEFWLRWALALAVSAWPVWEIAAAVDDAKAGMLFSLLTIAGSAALTKLPFVEKQVELIGHAVEVIVADADGYLELEAVRMQRGYGAMFGDMSVAEIARAVRRRFGVARVLIALLRRRIGA